jgi:hypothetical protein
MTERPESAPDQSQHRTIPGPARVAVSFNSQKSRSANFFNRPMDGTPKSHTSSRFPIRVKVHHTHGPGFHPTRTKLPWGLQDLPMDQPIGTLLHRILFSPTRRLLQCKNIFSSPSRFTLFNSQHRASWTSTGNAKKISLYRLSVYRSVPLFVSIRTWRLKYSLLPLTHSGVCEAPKIQDETRRSASEIHRHSLSI